jgi:hypothetical protein
VKLLIIILLLPHTHSSSTASTFCLSLFFRESSYLYFQLAANFIIFTFHSHCLSNNSIDFSVNSFLSYNAQRAGGGGSSCDNDSGYGDSFREKCRFILYMWISAKLSNLLFLNSL